MSDRLSLPVWVVIGVATYHRKILCINNFVLFQLKLHQKLIINLGMTTPNCCICIFEKDFAQLVMVHNCFPE